MLNARILVAWPVYPFLHFTSLAIVINVIVIVIVAIFGSRLTHTRDYVLRTPSLVSFNYQQCYAADADEDEVVQYLQYLNSSAMAARRP